jgi:hypothetical protein
VFDFVCCEVKVRTWATRPSLLLLFITAGPSR